MIMMFLTPWFYVFINQDLPQSISVTYYTNTGPLFIITMTGTGFLLLSENTSNIFETILNVVIFLADLGLVCNPCQPIDFNGTGVYGVLSLPMPLCSQIHNICTTIFFIGLFIKMGIFLNLKTKLKNCVIYVMIIMVTILLLLCLLSSWLSVCPYKTWLIETLCISNIGIGWLLYISAMDKE